jgi:type II secretory ATPase GspE/PulE/Tfp pilus assembly ATPase PilB-like protein
MGCASYAHRPAQEKTTTIYSVLRSIDALNNNVLTAESPIEVLLENISQTQIDDDGTYSYAMWARGILRQAPDIVMMCTQSDYPMHHPESSHQSD